MHRRTDRPARVSACALLVLLLFAALLGVAVSAATTWHVTTCADSSTGGTSSLRDIIYFHAHAGDTIVFDQSCDGVANPVITLATMMAEGTDLTIDGTGRTIIIDGGNAVRVFRISATVTLKNLTIQHGNANTDTGATAGEGGGILVQGGAVTLTNCAIVGNTASTGGGIYSSNSGLTITGSTISGNQATGLHGTGGGLFIDSGATVVTIEGSAITGNSAQGEPDQAGLGGGGIWNESPGQSETIISNTTITGNSAPASGGGGIINFGRLVVRNSTVVGNHAIGYGGSCNAPFECGGGGIDSGNAVYTNLNNVIVAGNSTSSTISGPDVWSPTVPVSSGYNLIGDPDSTTGWLVTDHVGTHASPLDPHLGPLASNGGPTLTMALLPGSLAIGGGLPNACVAGTYTNGVDQRGSPRQAATCAIGAYEPPFVLAPAPASGGVAGGNRVALTGGGFFPDASVLIGGQPCGNVAVTSLTALSCTAPRHGAGAADISVTSGGGTGTLGNGYTFGVVNALPSPAPPGPPASGANPLPALRPSGGGGGNPNPLPHPRP
jgi:hypothetical protein